MATVKRCYLRNVENSGDMIDLPHNKKVILGRLAPAVSADSICSREQVSVTASLEQNRVEVIPLGKNSSGLNGFRLIKNKPYKAKNGDIIEILLNKYSYEILFDPLLHESDTFSMKRRIDIDDDNSKEFGKKVKKNSDVFKIFNTGKQSNESRWEQVDDKTLYIYSTKNIEASAKIAAYDLDGTLITTKSGAVFPKDANDWQFAYPQVKTKLKQLHSEGYKIVIFTNQAGIPAGKICITDFKRKIENIISALDIAVQGFISTGRGIYRKPIPGMWNVLKSEKNENISIDISNSFYCGDAAGRNKNWAPKKKKDHSVSDRLFALNIGLQFYTPEEHFQGGKKAPYTMPSFDPRNLNFNIPLCEGSSKIVSTNQEVLIFVGSPGSGKSFVCKNELISRGYVYVNRDTLKSWQRCVEILEQALIDKKSAVIDNTNPDKESRKRYIDISNKYNVHCRCLLMLTDTHHARHNIKFRELTDKNHQLISEIIINAYKNKYEEPNIDEGFQEIVKVNCVPKFKDASLKELYFKFLLEK